MAEVKANNLISRFWKSLAGVGYYPELAAGGFGPAFGYLSLLLVLILAVTGIKVYDQTRTITTYLAENLAEMPDFELKDGEFSFFGPMPYIYSDGSLGFIIDTTGETDHSALVNYDQGFLLTADEAYFINEQGQIKSAKWDDLPLAGSREGIIDFLPGFTGPLFALSMTAVVFYQFAAKLISVLVLGFLVWIFTGAKRPSFAETAAVACYALTLPMLLALAKYYLQPDMPYFGYAYWGLALAWAVPAAVRIKNTQIVQPTIEPPNSGAGI